MELDRWIENSLKIQSIPAPTFHEADRARYMLKAFEELNFDEVGMDDGHNVFGRISGESSKPLIISAHLDSVFPIGTDLTHYREQDRISGPGIGDNAVALGALIELAHDFMISKPQSDIWLVANVGEEGLGNLNGMRQVVARFGEDVLAYLVLEGMALGHIYHRGLPIHRYRITAYTPGGHAWIHAGRPSAIHTLCQLGTRLVSFKLAEKQRWSLNIGRIRGGTSINTIAPEAEMEIDLRAEDPRVLERLERLINQAIDGLSDQDTKFQISEIGNRPWGEIPPDHPLVEAARQALIKAGIETCYLEMGSTDANIPLSKNLPSICIGLTYGSGAHTLDEYIEIQPLEVGYGALLTTIDACLALD